MECAEFPKEVFRSNNGEVVLSILVGKSFYSKFFKKEKAFLDEIIFMISKSEIANIQEQPVASILISSFSQPIIHKIDPAKIDAEGHEIKDQVFHFQAPIIGLSSKRKRLIFPLEQLTNKITGNGKVKIWLWLLSRSI